MPVLLLSFLLSRCITFFDIALKDFVIHVGMTCFVVNCHICLIKNEVKIGYSSDFAHHYIILQISKICAKDSESVIANPYKHRAQGAIIEPNKTPHTNTISKAHSDNMDKRRCWPLYVVSVRDQIRSMS